MGSIIALAGVVALAIGGVSVLSKVMGNWSPNKGKIKKDLEKIKAELAPWVSDLVPFDKNEIELLSLNQINKKAKKGIVKTAKGIFTSIYHEPMVAYGLKKYVASGSNALLYVKTAENEFIYRIKDKTTEIVINNQMAGVMKNDGGFYGAKSNKLLAKVNKDSEELLLPVIVGNREVGSIVNPTRSDKTNARALEYVGEMNKEEETLFLSLAVLELVQRSL